MLNPAFAVLAFIADRAPVAVCLVRVKDGPLLGGAATARAGAVGAFLLLSGCHCLSPMRGAFHEFPLVSRRFPRPLNNHGWKTDCRKAYTQQRPFGLGIRRFAPCHPV